MLLARLTIPVIPGVATLIWVLAAAAVGSMSLHIAEGGGGVSAILVLLRVRVMVLLCFHPCFWLEVGLSVIALDEVSIWFVVAHESRCEGGCRPLNQKLM